MGSINHDLIWRNKASLDMSIKVMNDKQYTDDDEFHLFHVIRLSTSFFHLYSIPKHLDILSHVIFLLLSLKVFTHLTNVCLMYSCSNSLHVLQIYHDKEFFTWTACITETFHTFHVVLLSSLMSVLLITSVSVFCSGSAYLEDGKAFYFDRKWFQSLIYCSLCLNHQSRSREMLSCPKEMFEATIFDYEGILEVVSSRFWRCDNWIIVVWYKHKLQKINFDGLNIERARTILTRRKKPGTEFWKSHGIDIDVYIICRALQSKVQVPTIYNNQQTHFMYK